MSVAKVWKWSKSVVQLLCDKWSETAESLIFFNHVPVRLATPICSAALVKKWH